MRDTARHGAADVGGGFGMPETADSTKQLQSAVARVLRSKGRDAMAAIWQASGTDLNVSDGWCIGAVHIRARFERDTSLQAIAAYHRIPAAVLAPAFAAARVDGYLIGDDDHLSLTPAAQYEIDLFTAAMRSWLADELRDWGAGDEELNVALDEIARRIVDDEPQLGAGPPELEQAHPR